jgi:hypothetical protein
MVIRQIHQIITRHQATYEARNDLGQIVHPPLRHGEWKLQPNHVQRPDGTLLEYSPPGQVQPQLERLVELYTTAKGEHPYGRPGCTTSSSGSTRSRTATGGLREHSRC